MTLLASSLGGPLHPTNVVTSWLKKCLLSLFESRSPGTFPPFNNNILISNIHIPLYSPQNTNRYRFFRRIKSVSISGQRSLISELKHLWQKDTNNRDSEDCQRAVVVHLWRPHTHADLQTCPSHVCQDAHNSHLSEPARPHEEAEVCAYVWSSMKCHWSNSKETPLQTRSSPWGTLSFHLTGQSHFPRQTQTSWSYPLPVTERRHWVGMLDGSFQNHWVLINYHLLLLKCLLNSAWAPSGWTEQLVNRTCDSHEIRIAYCYYVTWYLVVLS